MAGSNTESIEMDHGMITTAMKIESVAEMIIGNTTVATMTRMKDTGTAKGEEREAESVLETTMIKMVNEPT